MTNTKIKNHKIWSFFSEISAIPRPSGREGKVIDYLKKFAKQKCLFHAVDKIGNLLIKIPATKDKQFTPGVILQSHVDMICLGKPDPSVFGVKPIVDYKSGWLKTSGTTLGADNGVGMAVMLALVEDEFDHGPLTLIFTVDEEKGLKGAFGMSFSENFKEYRYLLNLDSEAEEKVTIGCAGGGDSIISLPMKKQPAISGDIALQINIDRLLGGHSGVDVKDNRLNSIKLMVGLLQRISRQLGVINLLYINAGDARNVIPKSAEAAISFKAIYSEKVKKIIFEFEKEVKSGLTNPEEKKFRIIATPENEVPRPALRDVASSPPSVELKSAEAEDGIHTRPENVPWSSAKEGKALRLIMAGQFSQNLISLLGKLPHGVVKWDPKIKGLVRTSNNLATVESKNDQIIISLMTRSSNVKELELERQKMKMLAKEFGAKIEQPQSYPGWQPQPNSELVKIVQKVYKKLYRKQIIVKAIHAGLECGMILAKYPHLQAVSIGPDITGAHSIDEKVDIASAERFYGFTKNLLQELSSLKGR